MRKLSDRQLAAPTARQLGERDARQWRALDNVVAYCGSQAKLAAHFGVSYQAVQHWYANGVPFEHCPTMETLTRGAVQCEQLREEYSLLNERPYRKAHSIYRAGDKPCIYLAGPMTGYPDMNRPAFHAEAARLRAGGLDVVNPAEVTLDGDPSWEDYMRADLRQMMRCSAICLLPGWEGSPGACLEHSIAVKLGFEIMFIAEPA